MKNTVICLLVTTLFLSGCATMDNTKTRWSLIGAGVASGAAIGATTAPEDEKKSFHAFTWGAALGLIGALIGEIFFSDKKEVKKVQTKFDDYKSKYEFVEVDQKHGFIPDAKVQNGKKPVIWSIKKGVKWFEESPTKRYKAEKLYEVIEEKKANGEDKK